MLVTGGLLFMFAAHSQLLAGHFVFDNASNQKTTFAWSGYGVGALFILLAFLPSSKWVAERISTKKVKRSRTK
jgi:hypothetical protein